jgi:hypothetical protein
MTTKQANLSRRSVLGGPSRLSLHLLPSQRLPATMIAAS